MKTRIYAAPAVKGLRAVTRVAAVVIISMLILKHSDTFQHYQLQVGEQFYSNLVIVWIPKTAIWSAD